MTKEKYVPCAESAVPRGVRFDCIGADKGQICEVEYGGFGRAEHGPDAPFRRSRDTSIAGNTPWTYEKRVSS